MMAIALNSFLKSMMMVPGRCLIFKNDHMFDRSMPLIDFFQGNPVFWRNQKGS